MPKLMTDGSILGNVRNGSGKLAQIDVWKQKLQRSNTVPACSIDLYQEGADFPLRIVLPEADALALAAALAEMFRPMRVVN